MSSRVFLVSLCLASLVSACGRSEAPGVSREPLAKGALMKASPASPPTPGGKPAPGNPALDKAGPDKAALDQATAGEVARPAKLSKASSAKASKSPDSPAAIRAEKNPSDPAAVGAGLTVKRLVVTRSIDNREPTEAGTLSASDEGPLMAFVEIENKADVADSVAITFEREGQKSVGHIKLEVPAKNSRWRTWGKTRQVRSPGTWIVRVRTSTGTELAAKTFVVE